MAVSDAQRAARTKWDKENRKAITCVLPRKQAEVLREAAKEDGTSVNQLIIGWVKEYLAARAPEADKNESCET